MNTISPIKPELLLELAKICKSVYGSPINHKRYCIYGKRITHQRIIHGSFRRGFCRIFWNDAYLIIAFRGTREYVDWEISNLKVYTDKLKNCGEKSKSIRVHHGFQNALYFTDRTTKLESIEAIFLALEKNKLVDNSRKIIITGHSLGGAIATLFTVKFRSRYTDLIEKCLDGIVLFGCPSVGFNGFKKFYGELNAKTVRIINGSDIVPFTPPLFYKHVGESVWLHNGKALNGSIWFLRLLTSFRSPLQKFVLDHFMSSYISTIRKL